MRNFLRQLHRATVFDTERLLERFLADRDEEAFAGLVGRFGPLVLSVCRRVLHNADDVEDAFQATFLILARKAASIGKRSSLASWLHGVAYRVALRARSNQARRRAHERRAAQMETVSPADPTWGELRPILDEEISRLAERQRAPFVLCYLEGRTYEEAARELGWPKGTVATRLAQARERLRRRLTRRGLTLSAPLLAAALTQPGYAVALPVPRPASARAATLAEGVLNAMFLSKLKTRVALLLVLGLLGGGVVCAGRGPTKQPPSVAPARQPARAGENLPRGAVARLGSPLLRHANASALAFSADGSKLVSAGAGSEIRLWDTASRRELWRGRGEGKETLGAAFSADGKTLFTVGGAGPGAVCVWDTATGKQLRRFPQPAEYLFGVAFTADCKAAALLLGSNQVRVVDLQTGKERRTLPPGDDITPVAFSPDGAVLASCRRTVIELRDVDTGKCRVEFGNVLGRAHTLSFSPDGTLLTAAAGDGTVRLLDVAAGKELQRLQAGRTGSRLLVAVSSRGVVATAPASPPADGQPVAVRLWDLKGKELRQLAASRYFVAALAFSADGTTLAATGFEGVIHLWDVATGKPLSHTAGHQAAVTGALFAPDGKTVVTMGEDRTLRLWDSTTGRELRRWAGWKGGVTSVAFSPDGRSLVAAVMGGTVFVWDATTGKTRAKVEGHFSVVAPGGRVVAAAEEGLLRLWDVAASKERYRMKLSRARVVNLVFAPDGRSLLTVGQDGSLRIWDSATGKELSRFEIPAEQRDELLRAHLELSPNGRTLVALRILSAEETDVNKFGNLLGYGTVSIWNARTGERVYRLAAGQRVFRACRLSADGRALVTQDNRSFTIWEVLTGKARSRFPAPPSLARAFSWDGQLFAAGGYDGKVRLWSVETGKLLSCFEGHDRDIIDLNFSADGKRLASASGDGTALIWDVSRLAVNRAAVAPR